jgi:hypothetical protein
MPFEPPGRWVVPLAASIEYSGASSIPKDPRSSIPASPRRRRRLALHGASGRGCAICREGMGGLWRLRDDCLLVKVEVEVDFEADEAAAVLE